MYLRRHCAKQTFRRALAVTDRAMRSRREMCVSVNVLFKVRVATACYGAVDNRRALTRQQCAFGNSPRAVTSLTFCPRRPMRR
jgi:hypothetical protein